MGIAFVVSERDRPEARERISSRRSTSFKQSVQFVRKSHGRFAAVNFFWTNWELYLAPWQQLCVWYFLLLFLTGCGGVVFNFFEYDKYDVELEKRQQFAKKVVQTFENDQEKHDLVSLWAEKANEFMDINVWGLRYASFFAVTTYTTIGFGVPVPITVMGRFFVFFYGTPAIICYAYCAKNIGEVFLDILGHIVTSTCLSETFFKKHRLRVIGFIFATLCGLMAFLISETATDEGFGKGIYSYFDAIYFLGQTTTTLGFGDVMMSGSSTPATLCIGAWISTVCGVFLCLLQEMSQSLKNSTNDNVLSASNVEESVEEMMRKSQIKHLESQIYLIDSMSLKNVGDGEAVKKSIPIEVQPTFTLEHKTDITDKNNSLKSSNNKQTYITNNNLLKDHNDDNSIEKRESEL